MSIYSIFIKIILFYLSKGELNKCRFNRKSINKRTYTDFIVYCKYINKINILLYLFYFIVIFKFSNDSMQNISIYQI